MWNDYLWPTQPEPDSAKLMVPTGEVRDLTKHLAADGTLTWDVPPGEWIIQRIGMTPTGMKNSPASPEGQGLEVDKMNRELAQRHFDAFIGELLRRMPASERKAFKRVIADSYEMGAQNWTDGFDSQFLQRYGYDPKPWLPVLSGRVVGSADQSERFLWDLRRLVADRVATDYVGGLRDACKPHGLGLWLENYGHWGFPGEFLKYGSESDRIGGEYWVTGDLGSIECRAASSCANTYGKPFVSAEAFTGGPPFQNSPSALKARGDWSFCEGVNHFVLHVYIHQPWEDKVPGVNDWFGTEFNRHNTWFERSRAWMDYLRRSCWLLQQGNRVADVAYFIGEDAPKMTGVRQPELPPGRDFDYINADVIETKLAVENGVLTLPRGTTYRVLVLPELDTMRPEVLRKVRDLVKAGATVLGKPPSRSPSMQDYPRCDTEDQTLAAELWGGENTAQPGEHAFGKGRIVWGRSLSEVLESLGSAPDFESSAPLRFTHRRCGETDLYFVANPKDSPLTTTAAFRVGDKAPEFWWPDSGRIERPAVYEVSNGIVRLPLAFGPNGSVFVVFRRQADGTADRVVSVKRDGRELLDMKLTLTDHGITMQAADAGAYELQMADGRIRKLTVPAVPEARVVDGPWEVRFAPGRGAPEQTTFAQLVDWTRHPDAGIRHFSGTAVYHKTFDLPKPAITPPGDRLILDLGSLRDLATVRLNGRDLGTAWQAPFRFDITEAARPGSNNLEIEVVNVWNNRLAADAALPADQRKTVLLSPTVKQDTSLLPAGLLGPVTIRASHAIHLE
jgi:hypothetical protein